MFRNYNKIFLECHGAKIVGDPIIIPDNVRVVAFSTEYEYGYRHYIALFKYFVYKYFKDDFVDAFTEILYYFGSNLINMSYQELLKNCEEIRIKIGLYDRPIIGYDLYRKMVGNAILSSIRQVGINNKGEQRVMLYNPGDILNNYSLSTETTNENDEETYALTKSEILDTIIGDSYLISMKSSRGDWDDYTTYYQELKIEKDGSNEIYHMISRDGISNITGVDEYPFRSINSREFKCLVDLDMDLNSGDLLGKSITFKDVINCLSKQSENFVLFVAHCKKEHYEKQSQPQRERKRLQTLGLLQGIGLQLGMKSPKKRNVKKSVKKNVKKSVKKNVKKSVKKNVKKSVKKNVKKSVKKNVKKSVKKNVKKKR